MSKEMYKLNRFNAMNICQQLGILFIQLFDDIYCKRVSDEDDVLLHMRTLIKIITDIEIVDYNTPLHKSEMHDWFYTACASADEYMENPTREEEVCYANFIMQLMSGKDIIQVWKNNEI